MSTLDTDFPNALEGDMLRQKNGAWEITRDTPIHVKDMPGANLNEQFESAMERLRDHKGSALVILPDGWNDINDTLEFIKPGQFGPSRVLQDVTIRGGNSTVLWWANDGGDHSNKRMIFFPAAYRFKLENLTLIGKLRGLSTEVPGTIGIHHRAGWEHNINSARGAVFEQLRIDNCDVGAYIGGQAGPDITATTWRNCTLSQNQTGLRVEGANVAGYVFDNVQIGSSKSDAVAWHLKYSVPKYFSDTPGKDRFKDEFGQLRDVDWTDQYHSGGAFHWNARLLDSAGRDRNDSQFDDATARTIGGGPDIVIRDSNVTLSSTSSQIAQYAILNESASVLVDNLRIEGTNSAVMKTKLVTGSPNFNNSRFKVQLREINTVSSTVEPYDLDDNGTFLAGYPIEIDGGFYKNPNLPLPVHTANRIVNWRGLIRGPQGIIHPKDPELLLNYQMLGAAGSTQISTILDSSSNQLDATTTIEAGGVATLNAGLPEKGNALRINGAAYATVSTPNPIDGLKAATISMRFKIKSITGANRLYGGLLSRRDAVNEGWAIALENGSTIAVHFGNQKKQLALPEDLRLNQWYHLAIVAAGDEQISFWLDGQKMNTEDFSGFPASTDLADLYVGVDGEDLTRKFDGWLDDIRIYDKPLSYSQLLALTN